MSRFIDLTGQTFGRWTVLRQAPKEEGQPIKWICKCSCEKGTIKIVRGTQLRNGRSQSCGCLAVENGIKKQLEEQKAKLIGKKFGHLTVLSFAGYEESRGGNGRRTVWHCKCDCEEGNEIDVVQDRLVSGNISSCGCDRWKTPPNFIDLTGQRFGELEVIARAPSVKERTYWKCRCDCGNDSYITQGYNLVSGLVTHCNDARAHNIICLGSFNELEIKDYIKSLIPNTVIEKAKRILDGKEIDIYLPEHNFGIEYNGSAFHASENGAFTDKDKYYHRDKFMQAKERGIHLITVFDKDYEKYKDVIFERIRHILLDKDKKFFTPVDDIVYTDNDYDTGEWLKE